MSVVPARPLLSAENITHSFGAQPVLEEVSLTVHEGDRIGFIGRNGSGKSTLMRILSGKLRPEQGVVHRAKGVSVAMLSQQCAMPSAWTVEGALSEATAGQRRLLGDYHVLLEKLAGAVPGSEAYRRLEEACHASEAAVAAAHAWDLPERLKRLRHALDLPEGERRLGELSGGELRRVDLCVQLLQSPDVLILDEPTNHIDTRSVEWIEQYLAGYAGSCVLVTHDRYFLDRVANRIVELEFNRIYSFPGNYSRFLEYKTQVEESNARAEANRLAFLRRELAWYRRGPKARTSKDKHRMERFEAERDAGPPLRHREFTFEIPEPEPLGKTILEAREIFYSVGGRELIHRFSLIVQQGMRIGIIGPNGAGKTTLLRLLMGLETPRKGKVVIGDRTHFLYVDQAHAEMRDDQSVLEFVSGGAKTLEVAKRRIFIPAYLERFLFDRSAVEAPLGKLSGGEKNRLDLARKLLQGGNFLVLDEPTNDLDLYTLRVLEETIEDFDGCALIVSHDRFFLNRVCTHMLVFEEGGRIATVVGNYDDYLLQRERNARESGTSRDKSPSAEREVLCGRSSSSSRSTPRKLTYNERRELASIEAAIEETERKIALCEAQLAQPSFYSQPHEITAKVIADLDAAKREMDRLFARWEAIETFTASNSETA